MKKVLSSVLVSLVTLAVAGSAQAQSSGSYRQSTGLHAAWRPAPVAQDGVRLRFGVDTGAGLGVVNSFQPYDALLSEAYTFNTRLGIQFNNTWALMTQVGVNFIAAGAGLLPISLLGEVSGRNIAFAFGPAVSYAILPNGPLVRPGATLRLMGFVGSTKPGRRVSFTFGAESTTVVFTNGVMSTVTGLLGLEIH